MVFNGKKDRVSAYLHILGTLLSIAGLVLLVVFAVKRATPWHVATFSIFGASMILLYAASSCYHLFYVSDDFRATMRKIDHMMIYVLIAGTYTPICLVALRGPWGWTLFGLIWACALAGILSKAFWMGPRWLYTIFYIVMGWMAVIAFYPLIHALPPMGLFWLFGGGLIYSFGGICYALKWPPLRGEWFGFHELFHVCILLGTTMHFFLMFHIIMSLQI